MITNIDSNGRIQLPLAIRYGLHLLPGDKIIVDQLGDGTIILKKIEDRETLGVAEISKFGIMQPTHSGGIHQGESELGVSGYE